MSCSVPSVPHIASHSRRRISGRLLVGSAAIAIVAASMPRPAAAQSFQGTPTVEAGGATVSTAPSNTTVNINAPVTVINWQPDDTTGTGVIAFQQAGTTALFRSINFADFTVLNRILPVDANGVPVITRPIRFDGTVNSQFGAVSPVTAGRVWFYTPGGIILGASSAFNVGSLVLSTSQISTGSVFSGNDGTIGFSGTPNTASAITIENGAQVNALINGSSYVAMVAPRIVQNGAIQVDGSVALVGAEAVDITMSGATGLFDIAVTTGTGDANGVVHGSSGVTGGPATANARDTQRIYMMAIPKNSAISMLVNGNVGYTPAATATVQNGEVILSAGYNIAGGQIDLGEHAGPVNNIQADITLGATSNSATSFTSRVFARASGDLLASPGTAINGPGILAFSGSAYLFGDLSATVEATANEFVGVGGDLLVSSRRGGQGGTAAVRATGGSIGVGGDLTVDASSLGFSGQTAGISLANLAGGDGRGGTASLLVANGTLRITGTTQVNARGIGGYGTDSMGDGFGGNATVDLTGINSQIQFGGGLQVQAEGFGILSYLSLFGVNLDPPEGVTGGSGRGGSAIVNIDDVALLSLPTIIINASGSGDSGGTVSDGGGANGGNGTGGIASLTVNNEALILPDLTVEASGSGGNGGQSDDQNEAAGNGGFGTGGGAEIILSGTASLNPVPGLSGGMTAIANGNGGSGGAIPSGSTLDSGSGGAASGGTASISITGSSQVAVSAIVALADARTGNVGSSGTNFGGTGLAQGGIASININTKGTVNTTFLAASASTLTYQTSRTGSANGGSASIGILDGTVTTDEISVRADTVIDAESGQNVGSSNGMSAGDGSGGNASLSVDGGSLTANNVVITANGQAMGQNPDNNGIDPDGAIEGQLAGGNGRGGNARFSISGGSANIAGSLLIEASGKGGNGFINSDSFATQPATAGRGGDGAGGRVSLAISGGTLTVPVVDMRAEGTGGEGGAFWSSDDGDAGDGGTGQGGVVEFSASQDVFFIDSLALSAIGKGGAGGVSADPIIDGAFFGYGNGAAAGGRGGIGVGGRAAVEIDFDPALLSMTIDASGIGGDGGFGLTGGRGGDGFGGEDEGNGASLELNFGDLSVDALVLQSNGTGGHGGRGSGGLGGAGGNGTGGDAELRANGAGSNLTTLDVLVQANAMGGNGGTSFGVGNGAAGGNATGGNAFIAITNAATANLGATRIESVAAGGAGGSTLFAGEGGGGGGGALGGIGGTATGGEASLSVSLASATASDIFILADAQGGNGSTGGIGAEATGGDASVTATTGNFSTNNATITANARGGNDAASTGGTASIASIGGSIAFNTTTASANGETGLGAGGLVSILADTDAVGTSGVMTLGDAILTSDSANGAGGRVTITNDNGDPAGGAIQFNQLIATAQGVAPGGPTSGIFVRTNQSDILVAGNANLLTTDSIGIASTGQGTFTVTGNLNGTAGADIVISHTGQPGLIDTVRGTNVSFTATGNFDAQAGSIIRAADAVNVQATNGFANVDQLFAVSTSNITAGLNASLRNAMVTNGSLNLAAGRIFSDPPTWRRATATIQGAVTVSDRLRVSSGGDVVATNGAVIRTGNNVIFDAGDDIIIRNAAISSAQNVTTTGEIQLNAGAITPVDALSGDIHSLVIANSTLTSTGFDMNLTADAIDASTATIAANRFIATVTNAPPPGVTGGNDGGLLSANCVQGNICLGAITTPTQILVGPATGTVGLANRVTMAGSLASNDIIIRARDAIAFVGPINVVATNNLLVSALNGPIDLTGVISLRGDNALSLYAGAGAITGPNTALVSNGNVGLFANGGVSLGSIDTGGVLNTVASDGSITTAGSFVTPGNVTVAGQLAVRGGSANINSGGAITTGSIFTSAGNDVLLTSVGAQSLGAVNSGRDVTVSAASIAATSITAQRNVNAVVSGNAVLGNTSGNLVRLRAGQDAVFNGTIDAASAIDVGADGRATFQGVARAPNITVRSGDIVIGTAGRLGVAGTTQNVALVNSAGSQMTIGGSGVASGYSLSDAEAARIFADNIGISWSNIRASDGTAVTPPAGGFGQPSIVIDSLNLSSRAGTAAGNIAAGGTFSVSTSGAMQIVGGLALGGAGNANTLRLSADQSLQIIAGQGSITIRDSADALAGLLVLTSNNIIAASASAITDISGQTDAAMINSRLGQNDGNISDTGTISAATVSLNGGSGVFVQNSGSTSLFRDRRGITANAINVTLTDPNGLIVINGRITSAPTFATGLETIPLLSINGAPSQSAQGFDPLSTMNGCQITAIAGCRQGDNPISITDDGINRPVDPELPPGSQFPTALIELKDPETFGYPPLIDEPVTGSGNDDLWPPVCKTDEEDCPASPNPAP